MKLSCFAFNIPSHALVKLNMDNIRTKKQIEQKEKIISKGQSMPLSLTMSQIKKFSRYEDR